MFGRNTGKPLKGPTMDAHTIYITTRMHSNRMRTVCCSGHWGDVWPGGCLVWLGCLPRGVSAQGISVWGDVCPGSSVQGGVFHPALGDGVSAPVHAGIHTLPLWTEFLTHACENITFPQLCFGRLKYLSLQ